MASAVYNEVFPAPAACTPPKRRGANRTEVEDLEFSEYGRSRHIPAGWYLAPTLLVLTVLLAFLLA